MRACVAQSRARFAPILRLPPKEGSGRQVFFGQPHFCDIKTRDAGSPPPLYTTCTTPRTQPPPTLRYKVGFLWEPEGRTEERRSFQRNFKFCIGECMGRLFTYTYYLPTLNLCSWIYWDLFITFLLGHVCVRVCVCVCVCVDKIKKCFPWWDNYFMGYK